MTQVEQDNQETLKTALEKLSYKRRRFVEAYLECWNATRAAEAAGYAHPAQQASRLLRNVKVCDTIKARIKELALDADEVLTRLSEQATANVADFFEYNDNGTVKGIDTNVLRQRGHLVKKVKVEPDKIEIELYDGQSALALMGKHHQLFIDTTRNLNIDVSALTDEQLSRIAAGDDPIHVLATTGKSRD